jgi:C4-dicarboxylate-specific signal transduction histidine kinase
MDDKGQVVNQGKPPRDREDGAARDLSCSPDPPNIRTSDFPICSTDLPISRSPDRFTRSPNSNDCAECLAAMAHRLAQPITALRGGMELALMGKRTVADYRALLEQSFHLADDMAQLIISLRDLGESGATRGTAQCIPLAAFATEVLAEMESLAQTREIHLQFNADREVKIRANPERLREALQHLLAWVIQNSAGSGDIALQLSASEGGACLVLAPPRLDLQYLQIKVLEDINNPGLLFSHAAKNGALGWAINQRLLEGLGGRLEILTDGPEAGCIRVRFPLAPET